MTPAQRDLILAALGLRERNGRMPRWSRRNSGSWQNDGPDAYWMVEMGWIYTGDVGHCKFTFHVTRAGAEAAGVLGRVRKEHVVR